MSSRNEKQARLNELAAQIKDAGVTCENNYYAWNEACERLRHLEREQRAIWLSLFDGMSSTMQTGD